MQKYELVLLWDHAMKNDDRQKMLAQIESELGKGVMQKDEIGLLSLVYGLGADKSKDKAYFVSYLLELDAAGLAKIKELLLYNKSVIRYKLFRVNKTENYFVYEDLNKTLETIVEGWGKQRFGQKVTFFANEKNFQYLTWKAVPLLKKYLTRFGEMKPRRYTGNKLKIQKKLRRCILRAREFGLLDYIK